MTRLWAAVRSASAGPVTFVLVGCCVVVTTAVALMADPLPPPLQVPWMVSALTGICVLVLAASLVAAVEERRAAAARSADDARLHAAVQQLADDLEVAVERHLRRRRAQPTPRGRRRRATTR